MTFKYIFPFVYGMTCMYYGLTAWHFRNRLSESIIRWVVTLMIILIAETVTAYILPHVPGGANIRDYVWSCFRTVQMCAAPVYTAILIELCSPGLMNLRLFMAQFVPLALLCSAYWYTGIHAFVTLDVLWVLTSTFSIGAWCMFRIPKYNATLRTRFSYVENINLNWLYVIILSFLAILILWLYNCLCRNWGAKLGYNIGSLVMWMFITYFLSRHENVLDELNTAESHDRTNTNDDSESNNDVNVRIEQLLTQDRIYLNPRLKLSDVATMAATNRTYVSRFFNQDHESTFFDYINALRVEHACRMLTTTELTMDEVAEQSGFNSRATFNRVFRQFRGCSPVDYRHQG